MPYGGALFSEVQHAFFGRHFGMADFHGEHAQALAQLMRLTMRGSVALGCTCGARAEGAAAPA